MNHRLLAGAIAAGMLAVAGPALSQSRPSTPFVINPVQIDPAAEMTARENQPLLTQPTTSIRSARLDGEAVAEAAGWFKDKSFPAGTLMFGAYIDTGWSYCATAVSRQSWWNGDQFICYVDNDNDGRFDTAMDSGAPFNGVPLMVFSQAAQHSLPAPVPYSVIPAEDGPSINYAITFEIERPRRSGADRRRRPDAPPLPASHIKPIVGFRLDNGQMVTLSGAGLAQRIRLVGGQTATIRFKGAEIEILGVNDDDSVRYRVVRSMPRQVDQITLTVITTTYYTVY